MHCFICGEDREPAGYICQPCLDEEMRANGNDKIDLSPREAIIAMLNGETLVTVKGNKVAWSDEDGMFVFTESLGHLDCFQNLFRTKESKTRPMYTFECLAWVNSPESQGWMVSIKHKEDRDWGQWDIPQRFKYDGAEHCESNCVIAYRRAKVLSDKSGIDESTIQGFLKEV